jgi:hypothetical protein
MRLPCILSLSALLACSPAIADTGFSATGTHGGVGGDFTYVDRAFEAGDVDTEITGTLAGVHAYWQRRALLRLEGRLLSGSVDIDTDDDKDTESAAYAEFRATLGTATTGGSRLYIGFATDQFVFNNPQGNGSTNSSSFFVPVGIASSASLGASGWQLLTSFEGRYYAFGRESIDDVPGVGDLELDRRGGWGAEVAVQFRNVDAAFAIEPYINYASLSSTESESVNGESFRVTGNRTGSTGVRVRWAF